MARSPLGFERLRRPRHRANLQHLELGRDMLRENSSVASDHGIARNIVSIKGDVINIVSQLDRTCAPNIETMQFFDMLGSFDVTDRAQFFDLDAIRDASISRTPAR